MLAETKGERGMSNKLEQIAVRLEPELREKLQLAADQDRRPLAGLIRKILHDHTSQPQHEERPHAA
jgi:hypothetical protein